MLCRSTDCYSISRSRVVAHEALKAGGALARPSGACRTLFNLPADYDIRPTLRRLLFLQVDRLPVCNDLKADSSRAYTLLHLLYWEDITFERSKETAQVSLFDSYQQYEGSADDEAIRLDQSNSEADAKKGIVVW